MYDINVVDKRSGVTVENSCTELQHRLATGRAVESFYYDMEAGKARWYYCGKSYALESVSYDVMKLAVDRSGFCGYDFGCEKVDFYNETGEMIFSCGHDYDGVIPDAVNAEIIRYIFLTDKTAWWIFDGRIQKITTASSSEKLVLGFHSSLYVKSMNRLGDCVYNAYGDIVYALEKYPHRLTIGKTEIDILNRDVKPFILERYDLIATCIALDYYYSEIMLYDFNGNVHSRIPLPENAVAFHSIKLLEHTDVPVIVCYDELPDAFRYYDDRIANSVRPNMPMRLRWFELLPDEDGKLVLYKSGDLYQGFRDIDNSTLEDRHVLWR